ncbi:MAG TPA: diguanylate cyclase [Blastocatellia bacterium]|nr:diguanylate cyclase [Blastocatellia bacterium]
MSKDIFSKNPSSRESVHPDNSLAVWLRLQRTLADKTGVSLVTIGRNNAVIGRIENDNPICQAMRASAPYSSLCSMDCSSAYSNAARTEQMVEYRCHAGLHCFAVPVDANGQQLVVLGGRAFTSASEYSQFLHRYGDIVRPDDWLSNVKFLEERELREAAELVASNVEYHFKLTHRAGPEREAEPEARPDLLDAHLEIIRLSDQLESKNRALAHLYDFLSDISHTVDSQHVFAAILEKLSQILRARRASLMLFNEQAEVLHLDASIGARFDSPGPVRVRLCEGIAGAVLASGSAMMVRDADTDARVPPTRRGRYKTKSFISFPLRLGPRKIGVINFTERADGSPFGKEDLLLLELLAPHLALLIDRAQWLKKAETYQQLSQTDALTGLPNRRYLEQRLFEEVERSKRHNTSLSFLIIDVDNFKSYNDLHGHTNADRVLIKVAETLRRCVRAIDLPTRFAGDEFCVILPETDLEAARSIAERLREQVASAHYRTEQGYDVGRITISVGVSCFGPTQQSPLSIVEAADRALYQAKTRGRNCVAVYEEPQAARSGGRD